MALRTTVIEALPAWYSPALDPPNMMEKNLASMRLMVAAQGNEMGETVLRSGSAMLEAKGSTFYPFFMSTVIVGLVPPFSEFFYAVLHHYRLQALHLHANSVLLLSIFAYYCEAHVWVMPSVALLHHFFSLQVTGVRTSACAGFVAYSKANAISKAGKRVDGFGVSGSCWMPDASTLGWCCPQSSPRLMRHGPVRSLTTDGQS